MASSTLTAVPHGAHTIHTHGKAAKAVSEDSPAVSDPITVSPKVQMSFAEAPTVHWRTREVGGRARRIVSATRSESHKRIGACGVGSEHGGVTKFGQAQRAPRAAAVAG